MKTGPEIPWPPLVSGAKVPRLIRLRDWTFTMLAWLAMAYLLRRGLLLVWDYFSHPIFELTRTNAPDWSLLWQRLSGFVYLIAAVVVWLTVWGLVRRHQLRRTFDPRVTPSLPLEEHAASLGLDAREVERWRQWRVVTVHFNNDRIVSARPGSPHAAATGD